MSRKLVVASVAAAGVVALGSAAVASVSVSTDDIKGAVTGQTRVDDLVANNANGRDIAVPPQQGDLARLLRDLRGDLSKGSLTVPEGRIEQGSTRLANSVQQLSNSIERENSSLPGGRVKSLQRLTASLDRAAAGLHNVPSERVHESVTVNDELAHGMQGLERGLQRLQEMDTSEALQGRAGKVLDAGPVEEKLADVVSQAQGMLRD